jgi:hypothetical protein
VSEYRYEDLESPTRRLIVAARGDSKIPVNRLMLAVRQGSVETRIFLPLDQVPALVKMLLSLPAEVPE